MPWKKQYDETDVLERAMRAFWVRGYAATSINDLVDVTGINRGSIYDAFESKRALFIRVLMHYDLKHRAGFLESAARDHEPKEAILAIFRNAAQTAKGKRKTSGCLLVNTALECSPHDPEIRQLVNTSFERVEEFFRLNIELAKEQGTVRKSVDSHKNARSLLGLFLGLRVLARSGADQSLCGSIVSQAESMLR